MDNQQGKKRTAANRTNRVNNISAELGKIPPQAVDLEMAVLGAMMLERETLLPTRLIYFLMIVFMTQSISTYLGLLNNFSVHPSLWTFLRLQIN